MSDSSQSASQVRLKDIAIKLGVSVSVVSKALHNTKSGTHVSPKRIKLIQDTAKAMGYSPDMHARSLVSGKSYMIGLLARKDFLEGDRVNVYLSNIIAKSMEVAQEKGFMLALIGIMNDEADFGRVLNICNSKQIDGLLVSPTDLPAGLIPELEKIDFPMAGYFGKPGCALKYNQVLTPKEHMTYSAAKYLHKSCKRKRLLYMHYDIGRDEQWERHAGVGEATADFAGLCYDEFRVNFSYEAPNSIDRVRAALAKVLSASAKSSPPYDAIVADDSFIAEIAYYACCDAGLEMRSDINIVSLQQYHLPRVGVPEFTTLMPTFNSGGRAVQMLFDYLETGKKHRNIYQKTKVDIRQT